MNLPFRGKVMIIVCTAAFVFSLIPFAAAFSMGEFDPNSEDEPEIEWYSEETSTYEEGYTGELTGEGESTLPEEWQFTEPGEPETLVAPLDKELCTPIDEYVFSDSGELDAPAIDGIETSMERFYKKTGVQPYLFFTENPVENVKDWLTEKYEELFDNDGGHLLLYFSLTGEPGSYDAQYHIGKAAGTVVNYNFCEFLLNCIDECSDHGFSYEDTFRTSFENTAEYIMYGTERSIYDKYKPDEKTEPYSKEDESETQTEQPTTDESEAEDEGIGKTVKITLVFAVFIFCVVIIAGVVIKKVKSEKEEARKKAESGKNK